MAQGPQTEGKNYKRRPSGKNSWGDKASAIPPILFYLKQSHAGIETATSRKSKQLLTSGANSLFSLEMASVCVAM